MTMTDDTFIVSDYLGQEGQDNGQANGQKADSFHILEDQNLYG